MPVYTVHAPVANGANPAATDRFVFVRDGFHFWAAVASVFWLLWHRLWLALIGWIILMVAIDVVAVAIAIALYLWLLPRDPDAAVLGAISPLVFGAFFNLVIALVSLKP